MKMTSMKSVIQKLAFPLLAGGMLWSGNARADANGELVVQHANPADEHAAPAAALPTE